MNRLDEVTVSGDTGRRIDRAARTICIGHSFLTRYSSHVICVPITQRLSACSGDHLSGALSSAILAFFFCVLLFPPFSLSVSLSFNLFYMSTRHTRENLSRRPSGFSAIFRPAAAVIGRLPRAVMNVEILAPRTPTIIHERLKVAAWISSFWPLPSQRDASVRKNCPRENDEWLRYVMHRSCYGVIIRDDAWCLRRSKTR